jgi:hypothetical protein
MSQLRGSIVPGGCTDPTLFRGAPIRTERLRLAGGVVVEVRFYPPPRRVLLDGVRRLLGWPNNTAEEPLVIAEGRAIGGQALYRSLTKDPRVTRI